MGSPRLQSDGADGRSQRAGCYRGSEKEERLGGKRKISGRAEWTSFDRLISTESVGREGEKFRALDA